MNRKQTQQLIQAILRELPRFAHKDKVVYHSPVESILGGFVIDPSAFSKQAFYVTSFFLPLWVPTQNLHMTFGRRLPGNWSMEHSGILTELTNQMVQEATWVEACCNVSRAVEELIPFAQRGNVHAAESLSYGLIKLGKIQTATQTLRELRIKLQSDISWQRNMTVRLDLILELLSAGGDGVQSQLNRWELESRSNLNI